MGQGSKMKLFLNYLLKLSWLLDGSVRNVFPSPFYCSILIWCICVYCFARLASGSARLASRHPAFMGNYPTISHKCSPYIYLVDEFHFCPFCSFSSDHLDSSEPVGVKCVCGVFTDD